METGTSLQKVTLAFINDKSPILDIINNDLIDSGFDVLFRSETIQDGLSQLSVLTSLPEICLVDLDFYNRDIIKQLKRIKSEYPSINLIAHSDIDDNKIVKTILDIGFSGYLLVGSDIVNFKKSFRTISK